MTTQELDFKLLHYGTIITDDEYQKVETINNKIIIDDVRVRIIKFADKIYYHKMVNGEFVFCFELK